MWSWIRASLLATVGVAAALPSTAQTIFSANAESFEGKHSIEYRGIGWRNLRQIIVRTNVDTLDLEVQAYFACGSDQLLLPNETTTPKAYESYPEQKPDDLLISLGGLSDTSAASLGFSLSATDETRLRAALKGVCNKPVEAPEEPKGLYFSNGDDTYSEILPQRFSRSENRVSLWSREYSYRVERGKAGSFDRTFRIVSSASGYTISKLEIDCSRYAIAYSSVITYDHQGRAIDSQTSDPLTLRLQEAVPGSVGETMVQIACSIR